MYAVSYIGKRYFGNKNITVKLFDGAKKSPCQIFQFIYFSNLL